MSRSIFGGLVAPDGQLRLHFPDAFKAFARRLAGQQIELELRPRRTRRSDQQSRKFHALITPWAASEGWRIDDLKADLMGVTFGWSPIPSPLSGRKVPLWPHTADLTVDEFTRLITRTVEIAASRGHVLEPDSHPANRQRGQTPDNERYGQSVDLPPLPRDRP